VPLLIERLVVVGVGLIGGSFALALKQAGVVGRVVGLGRSRGSLDRAVELGVIDAAEEDSARAMEGADFVLLAMPVAQTQSALARIAPHLMPDALVTDAGSTKQDVVAAARAVLGGGVARFVPAHPIAGAEASGAAAARADLFRDRKTVITALDENEAAGVDRVAAAWRACGAEIRTMTPAQHDGVFAAVSHLPHLLAFALVHHILRHDNAVTLFDYAASGFRDFTRIASSHPEMWRDICIGNRERLADELARYRAVLEELQARLAAEDGEGLERIFAEARAARDAWLTRTEGGVRR